ncbi:MAG: hypothetical protein FWB86_06050 [Treponema sp.]|nr:hypothetical protein [Treponema sp.]
METFFLFNNFNDFEYLCIDFLDDTYDYNEIWEENCLKFIDFLKKQLFPENIFLLNIILTERYEEAGNPFWNSDLFNIRKKNYITQDKYSFFIEHFENINVLKLSPILSYTDKYHEDGCLPEHFNISAYQNIAETIYKNLLNSSNIPIKKNIILNNDLIMKSEKKDDHYRIDAYKNSCKYKTLRDWMYKKSISRTLDKYLKEKGILKIAIYGMAEIGQLFLWEMQSLGINVEYSIDGNADMLFAEIPILKPDDILPDIDAIIVCVPFSFEQIKYTLMQKSKAEIISIDELVYEA